jgi:hypothetical protein
MHGLVQDFVYVCCRFAVHDCLLFVLIGILHNWNEKVTFINIKS